jgi:hypothetical protein
MMAIIELLSMIAKNCMDIYENNLNSHGNHPTRKSELPSVDIHAAFQLVAEMYEDPHSTIVEQYENIDATATEHFRIENEKREAEIAQIEEDFNKRVEAAVEKRLRAARKPPPEYTT